VDAASPTRNVGHRREEIFNVRSEPLDGIKVLAFTQILAGPSSCVHLADIAAEVIKMEHPGNEPWGVAQEFIPDESK
jgi:crotonobetainyl-CoA:carnitine CoA-transferase CaiB-like acyl-CoA transferase